MSAVSVEHSAPPKALWEKLCHPDTWLFVLIAVVVPNALFLLASPWLMIRRALNPTFYLVAAMLALVLPRALAYPLFLLAAAIDGFFIVSMLFGLPFDLALASIGFLKDIDVVASLLYSAGIALLVTIAIVSAYTVNHYRDHLKRASLIPALLAVNALILFDYATNSYNPGMPATFESALQQANLTADTVIQNDRNVLLVLVEGMGAYADPDERALLEDKLRAAAGSRFRLTHGINTHYGSTSGAMSRELCGKWGTFTDYLEEKEYDCLPARLVEGGFSTISYDGFNGDLLSLREWYPHIGIQTSHFRDDLKRMFPADTIRQCGTALQGLCDEDVGRLVHRELVGEGGQRKFVYWLTLDSHLPYVPIKNGPLACGTSTARITDRVPCDLTEIWMGVFDTVASIAADPNMPPLDIMVVGDHNTPMWSRSAVRHFRPGLIDWYKLEYIPPIDS